MSDLLARLVAEAAAEVEHRKERRSREELERTARSRPGVLDFAGALRGAGLSVIAEMKQRTPSKGVLVEASAYRPAELARAYAEGGAAALSVLCHREGFGGEPEHLAEARLACSLPLMRKDFVCDEYQLAEARALGADAALLIVGAVPAARLGELVEYARHLGLEPVVEVHSADELTDALSVGTRVLGVNHRDLRTFEVDTTLTAQLRPLVPPAIVLIAESGIQDAAGARLAREAGADAVLVGEALMRAADPAATIRELVAA